MSQKIITTLSGTQTTGTWSSSPQRITLLNTSNVRYPRNIILTNTGVMISRGGYSVGVPIADILALCVAYEPFLSWPPVITVQPVDASCVHSSTAATFGVTATAEIAITYQWQCNRKAFGTLTSDNTNVSAGETVTIGTKVYTFRTFTFATATLTSNNSNAVDGVTVTIGNKTYTFKTALTPTEGEVLIGADADATTLNLIRAINHSGTPNTDYKCAAAHTQVTAATSVTAHAFLITSILGGTGPNSYVTTDNSSYYAFGGATMSGGSAIAEGDVNIGGTADASLLNLIQAINFTGTVGVNYQVAAANTDVVADAAVASHAFSVTAITSGTGGNAIASTETSAHLSWGGATLASGGWANATGTINGCAYTNGTTATLTCTPTTVGQSTVQHQCLVTDGAGTTTTSSVVLTIT